MRLKSTIILGLLFSASLANAQLAPLAPESLEEQIPPPPAFKLEGLIPLEIARSSLRFGVDPSTISVGSDRIVRYVVVAASPTGAMNALYEGIRCSTGEYKVYARYNPGGWSQPENPPWRSLHDQPVSRHSLIIARTGACMGHGSGLSASQVVRNLKAPADTRFVN